MPFYSKMPGWRFARMKGHLDRIYDELFGDEYGPEGKSSDLSPDVDITETAESYTLTAELPGISRDNISIDYRPGRIRIYGRKSAPAHLEELDFLRRERRYGLFDRAFSLPDPIEENSIKAKLAEGILTVVLPKSGRQRGQQIKIEID